MSDLTIEDIGVTEQISAIAKDEGYKYIEVSHSQAMALCALAREALEGRKGWRDILSAPKDGTCVYLADADDEFDFSIIWEWDKELELWVNIQDSLYRWYPDQPHPPAQWHPLPTPPQDKEES